MKTILLFIVGFISVAHAELFVGEVNTPLSFNITTAGYYKIELEGNIVFDVLFGGGDWEINLQTLVDSAPTPIPFIHTTDVNNAKSTTTINYFSTGQHIISATISVVGNHPERASANRSTWKYTVKSAQEIDYRNSIGDLQNSLNQQGTNVASLKNDVATLQAATTDQSKGLTDQVASLKKQTDKLSDDSAQSTAVILSAINGVSQQVNTVNNNVTTGNTKNQTLGIIGISLGAVGIGAGVGVPLLMKSENSTDVSASLDSDKESINYVSPGKGD